MEPGAESPPAVLCGPDDHLGPLAGDALEYGGFVADESPLGTVEVLHLKELLEEWTTLTCHYVFVVHHHDTVPCLCLEVLPPVDDRNC